MSDSANDSPASTPTTKVMVRLRLDLPLQPWEDRFVGNIPTEIAQQIRAVGTEHGAGSTGASMLEAFVASGASQSSRAIIAAAGIDAARVGSPQEAFHIGSALRVGLPLAALVEQMAGAAFTIRCTPDDDGLVWTVEAFSVIHTGQTAEAAIRTAVDAVIAAASSRRA